MNTWVKLICAFALSISTSANAHDDELSFHMKWYKEPVTSCIQLGAKELVAKDKQLEKDRNKAEKARKSIAPFVIAKRRLKEEGCALEAKCLTNELKNKEDYVDVAYGFTFEMCIEN